MIDHLALPSRAGQYEEQPEAFQAFLPADLPQEDPVVMSEQLSVRLEAASHALDSLDGIIQTLSNPDRFVCGTAVPALCGGRGGRGRLIGEPSPALFRATSMVYSV